MNLALFDFDGTTSTREMYPDFVHFAVQGWRLALGKALLAPVIIGYKLGWVPGNVIRSSILMAACRRASEHALKAFGERFDLASFDSVYAYGDTHEDHAFSVLPIAVGVAGRRRRNASSELAQVKAVAGKVAGAAHRPV